MKRPRFDAASMPRVVTLDELHHPESQKGEANVDPVDADTVEAQTSLVRLHGLYVKAVPLEPIPNKRK